MKIVVIGGVAGGATVCARLRRLDEKSHIIMVERDEHISFANCGLPYHIGGVIPERKSLIVQTPQAFNNLYNIDVRIFSEVVKIDKEAKKVEIKETKTGRVYEETYDKLVLSPGASPIKPPTPGLDASQNVFTLRNIHDTDKIKGYVEAIHPTNAVIIGGGFIGLEMAENLVHLGMKVTIIELANQILAPLDWEMAKIIQNELKRNNVDVLLEDVVTEFKDEGKTLVLRSGKVIPSDITILSIGVTPENRLAVQSGLKVGPRGHIVTSKTLQTYDKETDQLVPDLYAVGDAIEVHDLIDGSKTAIALAWPANRQARLAADHIMGLPAEFKGSLGTSVVKIFNMIASCTGNSEKVLKRKQTPYKSYMVVKPNHATYYPGFQDIFLKITFCSNTGKIFGAQAVGGPGAERRIDVIVAAIKGGLTISDLPELELAYAPQFGSAKDPLNILGYAATNYMNGKFEVVYYSQMLELIKSGAFFLDVRLKTDYDAERIEGSLNIPIGTLRANLNKLPQDKDTPIYVICRIGQMAYLATQILKSHGYTKVYDCVGGFKLYHEIIH